jgi:hypothetical protein
MAQLTPHNIASQPTLQAHPEAGRGWQPRWPETAVVVVLVEREKSAERTPEE